MSSDPAHSKVPKRVPMACTRCRDRKVKCVPLTGVDVQRCERCAQQGHQDCEYKPVPAAVPASSSRPSTIPSAPLPTAPMPLYHPSLPHQVLPSPYGHDQQPFQGPPNPTNASGWNARNPVIDPELMPVGGPTYTIQPDQETRHMPMTTTYPGVYSGQQQYIPPSQQPYNPWPQPQYPTVAPPGPSYPLGGGGRNYNGPSHPSSNPDDNSNHPPDVYGRYQNPRNSEK